MVHKKITLAWLYVVKFKYRKRNQNIFYVMIGLYIITHNFQNSKHNSLFPTIEYLAGKSLVVTYICMNVLGNALNKFQEQINHRNILTYSKHISFNL